MAIPEKKFEYEDVTEAVSGGAYKFWQDDSGIQENGLLAGREQMVYHHQ